jgi:hypothetical protein
MQRLEDLEKQLSKQLGKKYRYFNLVAELENPDYDQKFEIAQQVLQEQDLGVFGAALEYQKWYRRS